MFYGQVDLKKKIIKLQKVHIFMRVGPNLFHVFKASEENIFVVSIRVPAQYMINVPFIWLHAEWLLPWKNICFY